MYHSMFFIYDGEKDASNLAKHGISLEEAKELWNDKDLIEISAPRRGEKRRLVIAKRDGVYWTAVITYRGSVIRIISARRSTEKEKKHYDRSSHRNNR